MALRWLRFNGIVIGLYLLAFVLWEVASRVFAIPTFILPSPLTILASAAEEPSVLATHTSVTLQEVVGGFLLAAAISIPLGMLLIYSRLLERLVYPSLVAFQAIPKVALAPILVVWFGFGLTSKVVLALVTAAFPIVINTVIGMGQAPREMLYLMRSLRASPWQIFIKARLPVAAPYIFGGLKIGITLAVVGAVVGEFIASNSGLGYLLLVANNNLDTPMLFAVVVVLAVMSSVLFYAVEAAEAILLPRPLRRSQRRLDPGANA
ncbi:MAG: ABC transporter permease subunit [Streptosporangiales bacterium]|nr:ABC transporter permease subunit [Streptosporangiales bacterium]